MFQRSVISEKIFKTFLFVARASWIFYGIESFEYTYRMPYKETPMRSVIPLPLEVSM